MIRMTRWSVSIQSSLTPPYGHYFPINYLSRWLGHSSIQTTLIYLELVPDPDGELGDGAVNLCQLRDDTRSLEKGSFYGVKSFLLYGPTCWREPNVGSMSNRYYFLFGLHCHTLAFNLEIYTPQLSSSIYTYRHWAKSDRSKPERIHLLEHHLADVGACFETLLAQPTISDRLAKAAGKRST